MQLCSRGVEALLRRDNSFFQLFQFTVFIACVMLGRFFGLGPGDSGLDRIFSAVGACALGSLLGSLFTRGALRLFFCFGLFQALLARFKANARRLSLFMVSAHLQDFGLGGTVVLYQWNITGADVRAGTTLNTIEQVMVLQFFELLALCEPEQLLWQQARRAGLGTHAAADAGLRRRWGGQLVLSGSQQAVGGFDDGYVDIGNGETHHRAAHDQAPVFLGLVTGFFQQVAHRGADQCLEILRLPHCGPGDGSDTGNQRPAVNHCLVNSDGAADVLADHADL